MYMVTGAGGKLGREVVAALLARAPAGQVIAGSRSPERLELPVALQRRRVDFDDRAGLESAFQGVDRLLVISADGPDEQRTRQHETAFEAARAAGVNVVGYTSLAAVPAAVESSLVEVHRRSEAALRATGLAHLIFRNNIYLESLDMLFAGYETRGVVAHPVGDGAVGWISRPDIARIIARELVEGRPDRVVEVSGPEALSLPDAVRKLAQVSGREVAFVDPPREVYRTALIEQAGFPPALAETFCQVCDAIRAGAFEQSVSYSAVGFEAETASAYIARRFMPQAG